MKTNSTRPSRPPIRPGCTLEPGTLADFIILTEDIFAVDPAHIQDVKVDSTYLGGELIDQRHGKP